MKKFLSTTIRIVSSLILIYFIYKETGLATSTFAFLMLIYVELNDYTNKQHTKALTSIDKCIAGIIKILKK